MTFEVNQDAVEEYKMIKRNADTQYQGENDYLPSSSEHSTSTAHSEISTPSSTTHKKKFGSPDYSIRSDKWIGGYTPYTTSGKPKKSYRIKGEIKKPPL